MHSIYGLYQIHASELSISVYMKHTFFFFFIGNKNFIRSEKTPPSAQNMHLQERKDYKRETHINQQ
jgi:hypothetical protein